MVPVTFLLFLKLFDAKPLRRKEIFFYYFTGGCEKGTFLRSFYSLKIEHQCQPHLTSPVLPQPSSTDEAPKGVQSVTLTSILNYFNLSNSYFELENLNLIYFFLSLKSPSLRAFMNFPQAMGLKIGMGLNWP